MNRAEAISALRAELDRLESSGFEALAPRLGGTEVLEVEGLSGAQYQIELAILWDTGPGGSIRVLGSVDDGGWRAFLPLSESRLIDPPAPGSQGDRSTHGKGPRIRP